VRRRERDHEGAAWQAVLDALRESFADALLNGADATAEHVVREAIEAGVPEAVIDDEVVTPALRRVGELWEQGLLSVADEHLATEISIRVLALQREAFRSAARRGAHGVVLAAVEGEHHVVGLQMAASVLAHAGYEVRMLGADLPVADLERAVERHRPAVVGLTATMPASGALLPVSVDAVRGLAPQSGVVLGGAAATTDLTARPGVAVCEHVSDAVTTVDALTHRSALN
jgi:methanogenic corrinoid protein MtbC1